MRHREINYETTYMYSLTNVCFFYVVYNGFILGLSTILAI